MTELLVFVVICNVTNWGNHTLAPQRRSRDITVGGIGSLGMDEPSGVQGQIILQLVRSSEVILRPHRPDFLLGFRRLP